MHKKIALVTGAGRGLGETIAEAYRHAGFFVIATDVDTIRFKEKKDTEHFTFLKLDVTSEKEVSDCAQIVKEKFGRMDVLVSNAGIVDFYPVSEAGSGLLKKMLDVNMLGLANLTRYFLPLLLTSAGRLIVISSESYKVPSIFQPYAVSKQALERLYESIRLELLTKDIKSVLIRPGAIQTRIMEQTIDMEQAGKESVFGKEFENFKRSVSGYIGKISTPEEVAAIVLKAGTVKRPKRIYRINHNPLVALFSVLPVKLKEIVIRKSLK